MDVYEAISRRMTVREFEEREIPAEIIRKLIRAGLQAPTNDHLRQWEFILVQDSATRERLISLINSSRTKNDAETLVNQWGMTDSSQRDMYLDAIPKQYAMLLRAGCLMIPCFRATGKLLQPETLSSLNSFASIWCCIENILIAAAAEGIFGVTRIPAEREREHLRHVLNIPEMYEVPCYLALGSPAPTARRLKQHEINIEEKIHLNIW